jgi:hypothetical protein
MLCLIKETKQCIFWAHAIKGSITNVFVSGISGLGKYDEKA